MVVTLMLIAAGSGYILRMETTPDTIQKPTVQESAASEEIPSKEEKETASAVKENDFTQQEANGAIGVWRLSNTQNPLPDGYIPPELVTIDGEGRQLDVRAAQAFAEMKAAAQQEGISLVMVSGYRSYERQQELFVEMLLGYLNQGYTKSGAYAATKSLRNIPGTSEHQTGLAADILTDTYWQMDEGYANTPAAQWLVEHAADFGFILRYPKDKKEITGTQFEPWHYRYVGTQAAKVIMERGITLEEFLMEKKSKGEIA